jgi:SAM-dependent methyltransferase
VADPSPTTNGSDEYAAVEEDHWWFTGRRAVIVATLRRFVPPAGSLLDVGCGTGGLTSALSRWWRVEGVDASTEALSTARRRGLRVHLVALDEPLPSGYDAVGAFDVLEHVDDDVGFAVRMAAAARPGGWLLLTVPAFRGLWGPMDERAGHRRRYRRSDLVEVMARAGVRRVHATYFNTLLFPVVAVGRLAGFPRAGRELRPPPPALNRVLARVFGSEARVAPRWGLPMGASILFVGRTGRREP